MIKFVVWLLLILTPLLALAEGKLEIEKGGVDLLTVDGLSRPFTVFDQLIHSLGREADEAAKALQPERNDFTPSWPGMDIARGQVGYSWTRRRVLVTFDLSVTGMNDPWREVCERHIRHMASRMMLTGLVSTSDGLSNRGMLFLQRHLGTMFAEGGSGDEVSLQPFMDALVVTGRFFHPGYLRSCALDIKTNRMTYHEYIP